MVHIIEGERKRLLNIIEPSEVLSISLGFPLRLEPLSRIRHERNKREHEEQDGRDQKCHHCGALNIGPIQDVILRQQQVVS